MAINAYQENMNRQDRMIKSLQKVFTSKTKCKQSIKDLLFLKQKEDIFYGM